jgi:hypothetical protein
MIIVRIGHQAGCVVLYMLLVRMVRAIHVLSSRSSERRLVEVPSFVPKDIRRANPSCCSAQEERDSEKMRSLFIRESGPENHTSGKTDVSTEMLLELGI